MSDKWIMKGPPPGDPRCIRSPAELTEYVREIGFLPLFSGEVPGFSVEERVAGDAWWTGDRETDPWVWREVIASAREVAYGKFFCGKAGFISPEWLPRFANARRNGFDFDGLWQSGAASRREKAVMSLFMDVESDDEPVFADAEFLSTDLKSLSGFGKGGEKNYSGVITGLQMRLYLVIGGFARRRNRRGEGYGMPVSVLTTPERLWGYDLMSSAYGEDPARSWEAIMNHTAARFPASADAMIRLIGRRPGSI